VRIASTCFKLDIATEEFNNFRRNARLVMHELHPDRNQRKAGQLPARADHQGCESRNLLSMVALTDSHIMKLQNNIVSMDVL
jgi:hypothetical protein